MPAQAHSPELDRVRSNACTMAKEKYLADNAYEASNEVGGLRPANYDDQDVFGHEEGHQVGRDHRGDLWFLATSVC